MGFVVVSLSLGNSVFPLAHGGGGHVEAAGHLLLGEAQGFALLLNDGVHGHEKDPLWAFCTLIIRIVREIHNGRVVRRKGGELNRKLNLPIKKLYGYARSVKCLALV